MPRVVDTDNPPLTLTQLMKLRPVSAATLAIVRRGRGRPPAEETKEQVTLRLDKDVIEHFKKDGRGWQTRINAFLRAATRRR
ncbi:MAG: BrnA antitoxin family protein [Hyphomonadaceae bacterium]|nr:BrnA antitoxin family protein [Hyphomonadaceae bacterium]